MSAINGSGTDYASLLNQNKLNQATGLLGNASNANIGGLSGDLINQWNMLGANSAAYRKLLQAQETGTVKQNSNQYTELMSDKYFNDNYDAKTGKYTNATYKPDESVSGIAIDAEDTVADYIGDMRSLALAAISNPNGISSTHADYFEKLRSKIASNFVTGKSNDKTTTETEEAKAAELAAETGYRLLTDDQNFSISGKDGLKNYSFTAGMSLGEVVAGINKDSKATGVKAELITDEAGQGVGIQLTSTTTGKDATIEVFQNTGDLFAEAGGSVKAQGKDAVTQESTTEVTSDDAKAAMAAGMYTGKVFEDTEFTLTGSKGSKTFSFAAGTDISEVVKAINDAAGETGIFAQTLFNGSEAEGIGLATQNGGSKEFIEVAQSKGHLFAQEGKIARIQGSSTSSSSGGTSINDIKDLGKVTFDGQTYSFADLAPGGKVSLLNQDKDGPGGEVALAILDQALKDIYSGKAKIKGFDPAENPIYIPDFDQPRNTSNKNTYEYGNYGSTAMTDWLAKYAKTEEE